MNKIPRIFFISILSLTSIFALASKPDGLFQKRIENNYINNVIVELPYGKIEGMYNVQSKKGIEKRFFGDFNAKVEYFVDPSFRPILGFRIFPDSLDTAYLLEVKSKDRKSDTIVSRIIPVSDRFADSVYAKTVSVIDTYTAKGKPDMIFDGDMITFRCVVDAEVWTFTIHEPEGNTQKVSDLFRQMIADVEAGTFDETKYLEALN